MQFARSVVAIALAAACLAPVAIAADEEAKPKSGPPVGARTKPFTVQDVTGPAKGSRLCYI